MNCLRIICVRYCLLYSSYRRKNSMWLKVLNIPRTYRKNLNFDFQKPLQVPFHCEMTTIEPM